MPTGSKRNHYLPRFLIAKWAREDGKVWAWSYRPDGSVFRHPTSPNNLGLEGQLWTLAEPPPDDPLTPVDRYIIEEKFFSEIDDYGNKILLKLSGRDPRLTFKEWKKWIVFLRSLRWRLPQYMHSGPENLFPVLEEIARDIDLRDGVAGGDMTATRALANVRETFPHWISNAAKVRMTYEIMHSAEIAHLRRMKWIVRDVSDASTTLLLTDWSMTTGTNDRRDDYFIALPLGPTKIFFSAFDPLMLRAFQASPVNEVVRDLNRNMIAKARKFVVGDCDEAFLLEHKGKFNWDNYKIVSTPHGVP